jgi:DNA-binding HxlR family transcriptional regulator
MGKKISENLAGEKQRRDYQRLEDVVGCKWSVAVLESIRAGVCRPGALEKHIDGISAKVLAERLRKLSKYGLVEREVFPEVPPRTEYSLTKAGGRLVDIISKIHALDEELDVRA